MEELLFNSYLTPLEELNLSKYPEEVVTQFYTFISTVPFIKTLISADRKRACDLPKDSSGKIIIDITKPHILEDMDYFRPAALYFQKNGCYTKLRPNNNPNSEFGKWILEETRRCREGYVRPSDGEWITGDYYYFLNYAPMSLVKKDDKKDKKGKRVIDFPTVWEGHYLKFHALEQARQLGKHYFELASRSKGKSFCGASLLSKRFILGESRDVNKKVTSYITADDKKYLVAGDQTLDKFLFNIDWASLYMEWPSSRLINSLSNMLWMMGYKDVDSGVNKGTLNSVIGVTSKDDPAKLRGTRGVLYVLEEIGTFAALLDLFGNIRHSVEDGEDVFGIIVGYGTSGDKDSDFSSALEIMYNPDGYNVISFDNVYDKAGEGKRKFAFFFPAYMNRANCYDHNGNSDVTLALLQILWDRYQVKYNTTQASALTKRIAEAPIVPQEAMLRARGNMFPTAQIALRINDLDNNSELLDDVYIGDLVMNKSGKVDFIPNNKKPIRDYPLKDNKDEGAIEIFEMPLTDSEGKVFSGRYILGHDPVDNDSAESLSLTSTFVLDLWTDRIVAEYTGRNLTADENFEIVRKLCIFYNGKCLYENNKKGLYAYFSRFNCLYLLAETPEYLRDKGLIKMLGYGNTAYGVNATKPINDYANGRILDWLLKKVPTVIKNELGEEVEVELPNLMFIKNRALLKELLLFNDFNNFDRVRALGMVMLYREEKMVAFNGDLTRSGKKTEQSLANDDFFTKNYDLKFFTFS